MACKAFTSMPGQARKGRSSTQPLAAVNHTPSFAWRCANTVRIRSEVDVWFSRSISIAIPSCRWSGSRSPGFPATSRHVARVSRFATVNPYPRASRPGEPPRESLCWPNRGSSRSSLPNCSWWRRVWVVRDQCSRLACLHIRHKANQFPLCQQKHRSPCSATSNVRLTPFVPHP